MTAKYGTQRRWLAAGELLNGCMIELPAKLGGWGIVKSVYYRSASTVQIVVDAKDDTGWNAVLTRRRLTKVLVLADVDADPFKKAMALAAREGLLELGKGARR